MAKVKDGPKVVTANRLQDGLVVFLGQGSVWHEDINEANVANTLADAEAVMREAEVAEAENLIVEPYLIDVQFEGNKQVVPIHIRERLRTLGPSVRLDLGKQASGVGV